MMIPIISIEMMFVFCCGSTNSSPKTSIVSYNYPDMASYSLASAILSSRVCYGDDDDDDEAV